MIATLFLIAQVIGTVPFDSPVGESLGGRGISENGLVLQLGTGAVLRSIESKLRDTVSVKDFGAAGDGVTDDTAALQAARDFAAAAVGSTTVVFPPGTYKYSASPNWAIRGVRVQGLGQVTLNFTGTGNAWVVDFGSPPQAALNFDVEMQNLKISGNAAATNGLYVQGCDHCVFRDINVTNVSAAGVYVLRNTVSLFENIRISNPENTFTTIPVNGILVDKDAASQQSAACTFISLTIEGVSGSGIKLNTNGVLRSYFVGGTVEGGSTRGIEILSGNSGNVFQALDLEGNTVEDITVNGSQNSFIGMLAISNVTNSTHVLSGAIGNTFHGGLYGSVTFDAGANANTFSAVRGQNSGAWTDNGTGNIRLGTYNVNGAVYEPIIIPNGGNAATLGDPLANTITLSNNQFLKFKDTGGNARPFMTRGSDDNFYFGDTSANSNSYFFQNKSGVNVLTLRTDAATQLATVTLATLPTPPNGSMIYCSDCKNVADGAVAGAVCVNAGNGAFARRENAAWRCN